MSDAGLAYFAGCLKLSFVKVENTKLTEAGVKKLSAALPQCKIEWDGGVIEPTIGDGKSAQTALPAVAPPPPAKHFGIPVEYTNSIGMEFVIVPKGKSWLGGGNGKPGDNEVEIPADFYLGMYEVTQEEWTQVMGENPSCFSHTGPGKDAVKDITDADLKRFPVETVSWDDCQRFVAKLNGLEQEAGWVYRLPKAAEWEYAYRGGPMSDKQDSAFDFYFAKPTNTLLPEQANFQHGKELKRTCKVGSYEPNGLNLYDLSGNVWEVCDDTLKSADEAAPRAVMNHGGGWHGESFYCRAAHFGMDSPSYRGIGGLGLRLARVPSGAPAVAAKTPSPAIAPFSPAEATAHQAAWANYLGVPPVDEVALPGGQSMSFSVIPPGEFSMATGYRVRLTKPIQIGCHEVTQAQFRTFVEAAGYRTDAELSGHGGYVRVEGKFQQRPEYTWRHASVAQGDDHPVGQVSWNDGVAYCQWLSQQTGRKYRLPSEAEWEWACRAGSSAKYPWGGDASLLPEHAWYLKNSEGQAHAVGLKRPNAWGLCDMLGNVAEYCHDWKTDKPPQGTEVDPFGPATGKFRQLRGEGFFNAGPYCDVHGNFAPHGSYFHFGFRVVREPDASDRKPVGAKLLPTRALPRMPANVATPAESDAVSALAPANVEPPER